MVVQTCADHKLPFWHVTCGVRVVPVRRHVRAPNRHRHLLLLRGHPGSLDQHQATRQDDPGGKVSACALCCTYQYGSGQGRCGGGGGGDLRCIFSSRNILSSLFLSGMCHVVLVFTNQKGQTVLSCWKLINLFWSKKGRLRKEVTSEVFFISKLPATPNNRLAPLYAESWIPPSKLSFRLLCKYDSTISRVVKQEVCKTHFKL